MTNDENKLVKPKRKHNNNPMGEGALIVEPGDNARYLQHNLNLFKLPRVNLKNPTEIKTRVADYFAICQNADMKPSVAGLALSLGISRSTLWALTHDRPISPTTKVVYPRDTVDALKVAYDILEGLWQDYMQNGKINPVSGIFLAKNLFNYQDKTEYVLTPNQNANDIDADSIRDRYLTDSATDSDSLTDSD